MSNLFNANIRVRVVIEGCPERGVEALDWRRTRGLTERLDNRHDVSIQHAIDEASFRALVAAGWYASTHTDGSATVDGNRLRQEYDPAYSSSYGHCATIPVEPGDTCVDIACRALVACAREQWDRDHDVDRLRDAAREAALAYDAALVGRP